MIRTVVCAAWGWLGPVTHSRDSPLREKIMRTLSRGCSVLIKGSGITFRRLGWRASAWVSLIWNGVTWTTTNFINREELEGLVVFNLLGRVHVR